MKSTCIFLINIDSLFNIQELRKIIAPELFQGKLNGKFQGLDLPHDEKT